VQRASRRSLRTCIGHSISQRAASAISCATASSATWGARLTFHYDRKQIILERSEISENLGGQYVELYDFADRPLEVRWKGLLLPYRVFSKNQRVSYTAIVENKRLGHALAVVKAQQDLRNPPKVMTNSEKTGYQKRRSIVNAPLLLISDVLKP
jgi:hypothetical protein